MIGTISDDGRALGCPHIHKARLPQTLAGVVHRVPWLRARVHLPETVTTMYCWDAGDGVGAPAGCEGVGAAVRETGSHRPLLQYLLATSREGLAV